MVNKVGVAVIAIFSALLLIGQFVPGMLAERELPFATISKGTTGGYNEPKNVIRSESGEMFVELYMGEFPTGGYSIEVKSVREFPDRIIIKADRTYPGNCIVTQQLTQPFNVIKMPNTSKQILYEYRDKTMVC